MIKQFKCKPEHFFITTFTKNACNELKKRLEKYLNKTDIDLMTIGTFHSISYSHVIEYEKNNNIIDDNIEQYLYDFYNLLEEKKYKKKFFYIFIDEYQDINLIQENIITRLYDKKECKFLLTVGDDQQNIYTFRNTNISFILEFTKKYNDDFLIDHLTYDENYYSAGTSNSFDD
jgi:superfamily I DNA/RNA helicase